MNTKRKSAVYWIATALVVLPNLGAGVGYLTGAMSDDLGRLGYPMYFAAILGTWKVLGSLVILSPQFAPWMDRAKDAAYGGYFVVFSGAVVSHAAIGDNVQKVAPPALMAVLLIVSYALRPTSRTATDGPAAHGTMTVPKGRSVVTCQLHS